MERIFALLAFILTTKYVKDFKHIRNITEIALDKLVDVTKTLENIRKDSNGNNV